jgi:5-methylcytosine-specific restriction endonuclease McrA
MSKPCKKCGGTKRYKNGGCAVCQRANVARYRATEHGKRKIKEYEARKKDERAEYMRQYRKTDAGQAVQERYRKSDKRRKVLAKYHKSDGYKQVNVRYRNTPKGQAAAKRAKTKRRSLEFNAVGMFTADEWIDLCERFGNKCVCCGRSDAKLTVDHVIPLVAGGDNTIDNIQPLCFECNRSKWKDVTDYRTQPI